MKNTMLGLGGGGSTRLTFTAHVQTERFSMYLLHSAGQCSSGGDPLWFRPSMSLLSRSLQRRQRVGSGWTWQQPRLAGSCPDLITAR